VEAVRHFLGFAEDSDARVLFAGAVVALLTMSTSLCEWVTGRAQASGAQAFASPLARGNGAPKGAELSWPD
jgi:hypothetical protein